MTRNLSFLIPWNQAKFNRRPLWLRILIPVGLSLLVAWLTLHPLFIISYRTPFLFDFGVVFLSAAYGGSRSSLVATLAATLFSFLFILPTHHSDAKLYAIATLLFMAEALLVSGLFRLIESVHQQLRASEEKFRGIIEKSADGFLMADEKGLITYGSPSVGHLLGYTVSELQDKRLNELVHPEELRSFDLSFLRLLRIPGEYHGFLQRLQTRAGDWIWIEGSVINLLQDPRIRSLVLNFRNVSKRVQQAREQEDFVHITAHELKTPITALKGFLQIIRRNHNREERQKDNHHLQRMDSQLDHLMLLIEDMLNTSRIGAGELQYHFAWFNLNETVREAVLALQNTTDSHQLVLTEVPTPAIYGDQERIRQVITNLLNNAVKYSPGKEIVAISLSAGDGQAILAVKDQGIGIPRDQQEKIFGRFYRADNLPQNEFQGLGLGLFIAQEIIRRHQGEMGVDSEDGHGSKFWFSLPVKAH
jgi:PAS domain S-box-containing protein